MPTRDAIEDFNRDLVSLGNEPAVRARRGEEIEEVTPPDEGLSEDISELLGEEGEGEEPGGEEAPGEEPEGEEAPGEEPEAPSEPEAPTGEPEGGAAETEPGTGGAAETEPEAGGPEAGEDLDLGDIDIDQELAELGLEEEGEGLGEPEAETPGGEPGLEAEASGETEAPGEPGAGGAAETEPGAGGAEAGGPEAGEDLDLGDIDIDQELAELGLEEEGEGLGEPEAETPGGEPGLEAEAPGETEVPGEPEAPGGEPEAPGGEPEAGLGGGAETEAEDLSDLDDLVSGEELAGLTESEEEEGGAEEAPTEEAPPEEPPTEEPPTEEAIEEPEELGEAEEAGEEAFEEPEEFDLSDFAEDFDFSPEEAEVPEFGTETGEEELGEEAFGEELGEEELEEAGLPEDFEEAEEFDEAEEAAAPEEEAEAAAPEEEPEEAEGEALAPEEAEEFSFDFGEEEITEEPGGVEEFPEEPSFEEPGFEEGAPEGGESLEAPEGEEEEFTFEDESFELPAGEEFEEPTAEPSAEGEPAEEEIDEFSLGDFGAEFGVLEDVDEEAATEDEAELNPALDISGAPPEARDEAAAEMQISEEEFDRLKQSLNALPLNLKLAVEEAIGEEAGDPERTKELVQALCDGESARRIADLSGKILDRRIEVPRGYEKRTGVHFEEQRQSFAYRFRENILPIIRVVGATMLALALVSFLAYRFVYRPLHANNLYEQGLDRIEEDRYARGNELFEEAVEVWPVKSRFYEYADAFIDKRRFELAAEKYEAALLRYPGDKTGMLSYAEMESEHLDDYEKAENLIRVYLEGTGVPRGRESGTGWGYETNREFMADIMGIEPQQVPRIEGEPFDYDALLLRGDNFMRWAQDERAQYENARRAYARALEQHGARPELMFRFLRYFIETDNREEVLRLTQQFQADPELDVDPDIYARLGGYLIDKGALEPDSGLLDYARPVLNRAIAAADEREDPEERVLPAAHYHLARYYRDLDDPVQEKRALDNALAEFQYVEGRPEPLDGRAVGQFIDTHGRLGEYYYDNEEYLTAREHFSEAIERYRRALGNGLIEPEPRFGRIHASYGDLLYSVSREYEDARARYTTAEENGYSTRDIDYKQGFIAYNGEDYDAALDHFFDAAGEYSRNRSILFATANALYRRDTLGAAEGYYKELLDILESQRQGIGTLLLDEDPEHRGLIEYLIKVQNNLGVTLQRLAQRSPQDGDVSQQGLVYLEAASEDAVNYNRNPDTGERPDSVNLAYLNMREILYPQPEYDLEIYAAIPRDLDDVDF